MDVVARIVAQKMAANTGQGMNIDNRTGASGNIGTGFAARAQADGHTLLLGSPGTMAINPSIYPKFPVRPVRDFAAVTQVVDVPVGLAAHPSVPVKTLLMLCPVRRRPCPKRVIQLARGRSAGIGDTSVGAAF